MLVLDDLSLNKLHVPFVKVGEKRKSAPEPALAEPAVADHADNRKPTHAVANGAADTASFVRLIH